MRSVYGVGDVNSGNNEECGISVAILCGPGLVLPSTSSSFYVPSVDSDSGFLYLHIC